MRISIHQPAYLPWLGYIEKMANSDVFVFLDTVQYSKNSFDNRNRILLDGREQWLTIPIVTSKRSGQIYTESRPVNFDWAKNHPQTIRQAYSKSPNFKKYFPQLEKIYQDMYSAALPSKTSVERLKTSLSDICWWMLGFFETNFHTKCQATRASWRKYEGKGSELILNICKEWKATEYYSGIKGRDYLNEEAFKEAGIKIIYQKYKPMNHYAAIHQLFTEGTHLYE